jgi:hypothetical protein
MTKFIDELINKGLTPSEALTIVRNIAIHAFQEGEFNMDYSDMYGLDSDKTFDDWFKIELNK